MLILLYGKPGCGKSTMASSMTKLGYKVHYVDVDNKLKDQMNILPLIQEGKITYETIKSTLSSSKLSKFAKAPKTALAKQPKGYLEYCDIVDRFVDDMEADKPAPADVLVCPDSVTAVAEHMKRFMLHLSPPKGDLLKPDWDIWAAILSNWEEHFSVLKTLHGYFKHIICICHEWVEREDVEGGGGRIIGVKPHIEGGFRQKISKEFHEVYRLETVGMVISSADKSKSSTVKKTEYRALTQSADLYEARTTLSIDTYMPQDFKQIFDKAGVKP